MAVSYANPPAWLMLADGATFKGKSFGAKGTCGGEICFNTGMTGYQEVFTDPSYSGQVLIMNTAYIGNYGVKIDEIESDSIKISGLIAKNISHRFSRMMASDSLENYLIKNNVIALFDIDTRTLVQHIRSKGAMNCIISTELDNEQGLLNALSNIPDMAGLELSSKVSTTEAYELGNADAPYRVAVIDFGVKKNILKCLTERNIFVKVFPAQSSLQELNEFCPHGYFLSNGPGDPSSMTYAVNTVRGILELGKPTMGICLGHQLLALASGLSTHKMHHGHRGLNHPVKNLITGKAEITTQNHGFGVTQDSLKMNKNVELTHINLNDGSIEGLRLLNKPAFSVQYHPEATPGPHDSRYLFDEFVNYMKN